ncbi:MAG: hypothetical protein AAF943_17695 [Pseudomonadota bacterium]
MIIDKPNRTEKERRAKLPFYGQFVAYGAKNPPTKMPIGNQMPHFKRLKCGFLQQCR